MVKIFTAALPQQCPLVVLVKVAGGKVKRWEIKMVG
jgi:hypothetical protein